MEPSSERPVEAFLERREAHRRTTRRRRSIALLAGAIAVAGVAAGVVLATRGGDSAPVANTIDEPLTSVPATSGPEPGATTTDRPAAPANAIVSFAAVGDIVMGSPQYGLPPDGGRSFFDPVDQELRGDVVMGNFEGALTNDSSYSKCGSGSSGCFAFRMPPSYARWLTRAGFTVLNLANNHTLDFGPKGLRDTRSALRRNRIRFTGMPGQITLLEVKDVKVAVLGFAPYSWTESVLDVAGAKKLVRKADAMADLVVVNMHAGAEGSDQQHVTSGSEHFLGENRGDPIRFAHGVVDAGADLVVGHSPHVLRGMEWYRGRLIAYSMGNFAGYAVFSLGGPLGIGGILQVSLRADGSWVGGTLVATSLVGEGLPALDPAERAHGIVRELSKDDFGKRGIRVSVTGRLRPPER